MHNFEGKKVWVAGSRGMVGAALVQRLMQESARIVQDPPRQVLDLRRQADVEGWMESSRPDVVFVAAARVGGILDNANHPADFIADNLQIETNIITTAAKLGVSQLVFLGSSCIYPKHAPQPLKEEYLLTGPLEETNRAYAMAKLAGIELVNAYRKQHDCNFMSVLPCNLYGPGDTYDIQNSHVIPALMMRLKEAIESKSAEFKVWGTGKPRREFMHVNDCADAIIHAAKNIANELVNIGTGEDISIADLVAILTEIAGYKGQIVFDTSKPDGTPRKLLDISRLQASTWGPQISLKQGLELTWQAFSDQPSQRRRA
ncbi:MAG: GDP-L-fucose synthase [Proteobacteria bacterium]|nr:GDP-L-fucose synthase [Pseudomonadota bacterium]